MASAILEAIRRTFGQQTDISTQIEQLEAEEAQLEQQQRHIDHLIEAALRSVRSQVAEVRRRLVGGWYAGEEARANNCGTFWENTENISFLMMPAMSPAHAALVPMIDGSNTVSPFALTLLLQPQIEASIPDLLREMFPEAVNAMPESERQSRLAKVRSKLEKLNRDREDALAELEAVKSALRQTQE